MVPKGLKLPPLRVLEDPHAESLPQEYREELQAKSLAAFAWRTLEALREAWEETVPRGRVELVMYDMRLKCGYVLGQPHIETMPFPWPEKRVVFYFYLPRSMWPVPMSAREPKRALGPDGVSVRSEWVAQVIEEVLETLAGAADRSC
jgi:hypothetical protein